MSTLLIVDDSPTDTYLARKCAAELFEEIRAVHNAEGVFRELEEFRPSCVIMVLRTSGLPR